MLNVVMMIAILSGQQSTNETKAIVGLIKKTQHAGVVKGDLKTYMSLWTFDARLVGGRTAKPGRYDVSLNRQQIENSRRIRFSRLRGKLTLQHDISKVEVKNKLAELRTISTIRTNQSSERVREIFKLRKTKQGWRAYENRWQLIETRRNGQPTRYDDAYWKAADKAVERQRKVGPGFELALTLMQALRFREAHQTIARHTKTARDWLLRAEVGLLIGDTADAVWSFRQAIAMGESDQVPPIVKKDLDSIPASVAALKKRGAKIRRDKQGRIIEVNLQETQASDADLLHLANLTFLKEVSLHRTKVKGTGLILLRRLESLGILYLTDTGVDNKTVGHLRHLLGLRILGLSGTKVGDRGIAHLARLRKLKSLFLLDARATDMGVARLQKQLAKCNIVH